MIGCTDTAIYPGAMMIKSFYTSIANWTVTRSVSSHNFAVWT